MKRSACPRCGGLLITWTNPGYSDGDVEPAGACSSPDCTFAFGD